MSWIRKSDDSFKATNKLIGEMLYNTSVHCSYYSCIQLALHVITDIFGFTHEQIETETYGKGSHNWLINNLASCLTTTHDRRTARKLSERITELKRVRVIADYKMELISEEEAIEIRQESYEINQFLKTSFYL
jgi:stage III sporulation protein SpoIIIAA